MAATVLTTQHYDGVRGLISPDVTDEHISDAYLSQQPFAPEAERQVRKRLRDVGVDVDALTGEALDVARLAMMHQCASELCLTAPQLLRQSQLQIVTEVQQIDWKDKQAFHLSKVQDLVDDVAESVAVVETSTKRRRALPFGAVGTERPEVGKPAYPYVRRVYPNR